MLRLLTDIAIQQRQFDLASEYCRQAQVVNSRVKDQTESAALLFAQAKLDYLMDFDADALDNARQSVQLYSAMGDRKASAVVYHMISKIQLKLGEPDAATAAARQGLAIAQSFERQAACRTLQRTNRGGPVVRLTSGAIRTQCGIWPRVFQIPLLPCRSCWADR